jgi:NAD(P)-dependent dehydrogenase (short-subunit alcohol dehydrogenase family)
VARTVETFGRLDYAFNNAARGEGAFGLTADLSEDEFDETMTVNLKAVWLGMKHQIRQMLAQNPKGGAVVNTSSVNGLGGVPQASLYAAAKGGVIALTKSAAREYAGQGIRINILVAGAFRTPMLESVMDRIARETATTRQTVEAQYGGLTASGRIGSPEEAAEAVLWLCSDAASYVIGHSMIVDGGMTCVFR